MENFRLQALERRAEELVLELREQGLINPDFELIGAIIFNKYKGSEDRFNDLIGNIVELRKEAEDFLKKLKDDK
jgi:uncharacterized protein YeeX (DUF496 family)